jgi:hypothetical protein
LTKEKDKEERERSESHRSGESRPHHLDPRRDLVVELWNPVVHSPGDADVAVRGRDGAFGPVETGALRDDLDFLPPRRHGPDAQDVGGQLHHGAGAPAVAVADVVVVAKVLAVRALPRDRQPVGLEVVERLAGQAVFKQHLHQQVSRARRADPHQAARLAFETRLQPVIAGRERQQPRLIHDSRQQRAGLRRRHESGPDGHDAGELAAHGARFSVVQRINEEFLVGRPEGPVVGGGEGGGLFLQLPGRVLRAQGPGQFGCVAVGADVDRVVAGGDPAEIHRRPVEKRAPAGPFFIEQALGSRELRDHLELFQQRREKRGAALQVAAVVMVVRDREQVVQRVAHQHRIVVAGHEALDRPRHGALPGGILGKQVEAAPPQRGVAEAIDAAMRLDRHVHPQHPLARRAVHERVEHAEPRRRETDLVEVFERRIGASKRARAGNGIGALGHRHPRERQSALAGRDVDHQVTETAAAEDCQLALVRAQVGAIRGVHVQPPRVGQAVGIEDFVVADVHLLPGLRTGEFQPDVARHHAAEINHCEFARGAGCECERKGEGWGGGFLLAEACGHFHRDREVLFRFGDGAGLIAPAGRDAGGGDERRRERGDVARDQPRPGRVARRGDDLRVLPGGIVELRRRPAGRDLRVVADLVEAEVRHHARQPLLVGRRPEGFPTRIREHRIAFGAGHFHPQARPRAHGRRALLAEMMHQDRQHVPARADLQPVRVEGLVGDLGRGRAAIDQGAVEMQFVSACRPRCAGSVRPPP